MADHVRLAGSYLGMAGLVCQLILLGMQLRTYRKTGHSSLVILAICSTLAVLYLGSGFAAALYDPSASNLWRLYLVMEIVYAAQIVLAIWGSASLFRAFADRSSGKEPYISCPEAPSTAIAGRSVDVRTDASGVASEMGNGGRMARLSRLWTLRRVDNVAGLATERSVALLGLISLVLWTGIGRWSAGPGASFNVFGLPELSLIVLMLLALAFVVARRSRPPLPYCHSLFIIAATLPVLIVLDHFTDHWARTAAVGVVVYALIYFWRALRAFSGAMGS